MSHLREAMDEGNKQKRNGFQPHMTVTPLHSQILVIDHHGEWWLVEGDDWTCDDYGNATVFHGKKHVAYFYAPIVVGPNTSCLTHGVRNDDEGEEP